MIDLRYRHFTCQFYLNKAYLEWNKTVKSKRLNIEAKIK